MSITKVVKRIDWSLLVLALLISFLGLTVLYPVHGGSGLLFTKQIISLGIATLVFCFTSFLDIYFFKSSRFILVLYTLAVALLVLLIFWGSVFGGAQSWFDLGFFAFQPTDLIKFVLVLILAKFFFKRHVEIKSWRHILVSLIYAIVPFILLTLQPDFGSAIIIILLWLGMILVSGLPKKALAIFILSMLAAAGLSYQFLFADYQQQRIITFFNPEADALGSGYSVAQSKIAIGSGSWLGKGWGEGTQSRLSFLPEYETDFVFSSYAEEWGFLGVLFLFILYFLILLKIIRVAVVGRTNFELLLASGILIYLIIHIVINIGMNLGLLPVTGTTLPFMSYGGSHLLVEFFALGIISVISKSSKSFNRQSLHHHDIL